MSPAKARGKPTEVHRLLMVVRPGGHLSPATAYDEERMTRFRVGDTVEIIEPEHPRSERQDKAHRLYRAVLSRIGKATGVDPIALDRRVKIATGRVDSVLMWGTDTVLVPSSITEMDGPTFDEFFREAMDYIQTRLAPGLTVKEIMDLGTEILRQRLK